MTKFADGTRSRIQRMLGGGDGMLKAGPGIWLLVAAAAVAAVVGVVLGLLELGGDSTQTREPPLTVAPPARGATPADDARNLSAWLRDHSR